MHSTLHTSPCEPSAAQGVGKLGQRRRRRYWLGGGGDGSEGGSGGVGETCDDAGMMEAEAVVGGAVRASDHRGAKGRWNKSKGDERQGWRRRWQGRRRRWSGRSEGGKGGSGLQAEAGGRSRTEKVRTEVGNLYSKSCG